MDARMFQVSTLQSLALGYTRAVMTVGGLIQHGETGLGTFEDVNGEMIVIDGKCYRAMDDGRVTEAGDERGVPFASVAYMDNCREFELSGDYTMESLKAELNNRIEEDFGLNSMHVIQVHGTFEKIYARSELPYRAHHVTLKDMLDITQTSFEFSNITGSLVGVYYPDYMDGINAAGWHLHFVNDERNKGGHVYEIKMTSGKVRLAKKTRIDIQLPKDPAFDTYSLKSASKDEIKKVEQG
ncbi:Alpha-acetolactate decarboxylase [Treponema sp. JC4]|nr:Alpha-acetolactate decarboxylase [Treponema sp. JC4]